MLDLFHARGLFVATPLVFLTFFHAACTQGPPPASDAGEASRSEATGDVASAQPTAAPGEASKASLGWREERVGGVGPGSAEAEITKLFGKPAKASPVTEEGATGDFTTVWEYPSQGVSLVLAGPKKEGPFHVKNLSVAAPSKLQTSRGIGVGSPRAAVEAAYAADLNKELSNESMLLVGTDMYEGIKVRFDRGVVSSISLGGDGE